MYNNVTYECIAVLPGRFLDTVVAPDIMNTACTLVANQNGRELEVAGEYHPVC